MDFIRHEDLDDYLDSLTKPTGSFVVTPDGFFIDDADGSGEITIGIIDDRPDPGQ